MIEHFWYAMNMPVERSITVKSIRRFLKRLPATFNDMPKTYQGSDYRIFHDYDEAACYESAVSVLENAVTGLDPDDQAKFRLTLGQAFVLDKAMRALNIKEPTNIFGTPIFDIGFELHKMCDRVQIAFARAGSKEQRKQMAESMRFHIKKYEEEAER